MRFQLLLTAVLSALAASVATYYVTRDKGESLVEASAQSQTARDQAERQDRTVTPAFHQGALTPEPGMPSSTAADSAREEERRQRDLDALARTFKSEPVDASWSAATERHLSETMSSDIMIASEIVPDDLDVSCRSSLCRVKARFGKYNDAADWGMMLVTAAGDTFGKAMPTVTPGPDGQAYLEMYALRK